MGNISKRIERLERHFSLKKRERDSDLISAFLNEVIEESQKYCENRNARLPRCSKLSGDVMADPNS